MLIFLLIFQIVRHTFTPPTKLKGYHQQKTQHYTMKKDEDEINKLISESKLEIHCKVNQEYSKPGQLIMKYKYASFAYQDNIDIVEIYPDSETHAFRFHYFKVTYIEWNIMNAAFHQNSQVYKIIVEKEELMKKLLKLPFD